MENLSIGSAPTLPSVPRSESAPVAAPQPAPPSAPGDRAQVSSEARGPQRAGASPNLMQGLEESYRLPPRTHNGGPPLDPETVRQGAVPGSTTANPQRGSYQIGSNPNVPPLRSQAAANIVITDPNNPGGARPHTLVSVEQNQEAIRQGRGDPRFAGYEKRSVNIPYENGRPGSPPRGVEIHYQYLFYWQY